MRGIHISGSYSGYNNFVIYILDLIVSGKIPESSVYPLRHIKRTTFECIFSKKRIINDIMVNGNDMN